LSNIAAFCEYKSEKVKKRMATLPLPALLHLCSRIV